MYLNRGYLLLLLLGRRELELDGWGMRLSIPSLFSLSNLCRRQERGWRKRKEGKCCLILLSSFLSFPDVLSLAGECFFPPPLRNKNKHRLGSTTCGEELQKIFKDWQSLKGLCLKAPKKLNDFKPIAFLTWPFLPLNDLKTKIWPDPTRGARDFQFYTKFCLSPLRTLSLQFISRFLGTALFQKVANLEKFS